MEHLAKAQVSYLRTVSELREKVTKLEEYPVLNLIRRGLSTLGEAITDQLNQIDKRTLTVIAMGLYIAWPHIAPAMRATIKSTLTAILDKLIYSSRTGRWLHSARARFAAILASLVTLLQPSIVLTAGSGGGHTGGSSILPAAATADMSPRARSEFATVDQQGVRRADGMIGILSGGRNHRDLARVWAPSLSSIAEHPQPQMIMPVVGRVRKQ